MPARIAAPRRYLLIGNGTLALSALALLASVLLAYPLADRLGLAGQIAAHLAIPVAAGFFKLGYVVRLAAQQALGAA